jgi:aminoglycoside/choline kinase family phosphotransferase
MEHPAPAPTPDPGATTPTRARDRLEWARGALGDATATLERASVDAGFRSYWRSAGAGASRIVMDSPPGLEDVRPWLRIRDLLEAGGVRVPRVLARDVEQGFLLLEDLGTRTLLQVLDEDSADALFDAAIGQLLKLQAIAPPADLPAYDEALLARELRLFDEWFLGRHLGMAVDCGAMELLDGAYRRLLDAALAQPRVLVHRDFMPRNLMPADAGPAVLDFQDAVHGPIAYDVLSLFKDAFASWPEARVERWRDAYHARAAAAGLPVPALDRFRRDFDWIGIQRHLKVIGIFARLCHRDGKPKYLADVPRFLDYLDGVLPRYAEFAALHRYLREQVRPALAARGTPA